MGNGLAARRDGRDGLISRLLTRLGDRYLCPLLVIGMTSLVHRARTKPEAVDPRLVAMLERKPARVVAVAAANRTARVAWAIMTWTYQAPLAAAARRRGASPSCEDDER